jgi:hypothetical protein
MPNVRPVPVLGFAVACAIAASTAPTPVNARSAQSLKRTVYVTVVEKNGTPVTDMKAEEFQLKYAGKAQEITGVKIATAPLRVGMVVSDRGTGGFQAGVLEFAKVLLNKAEFGFTAIIAQPEKALDYSGNVDAIREGILKIGKRGQMAGVGAQIMDGIQSVIKEVPREGYRPVIVVLRNGGEAPTSTRADVVREELRKSGAILYGVSTVGTQAMQQANVGTQSAATVARAASESEILEGAMTVASVIGDGAKESGGRHVQVVSSTMVTTMQQIANELLNQYEVTYAIPQAGRPNDRLEVTTKRKGVTLTAPSRVPN